MCVPNLKKFVGTGLISSGLSRRFDNLALGEFSYGFFGSPSPLCGNGPRMFLLPCSESGHFFFATDVDNQVQTYRLFVTNLTVWTPLIA